MVSSLTRSFLPPPSVIGQRLSQQKSIPGDVTPFSSSQLLNFLSPARLLPASGGGRLAMSSSPRRPPRTRASAAEQQQDRAADASQSPQRAAAGGRGSQSREGTPESSASSSGPTPGPSSGGGGGSGPVGSKTGSPWSSPRPKTKVQHLSTQARTHSILQKVRSNCHTKRSKCLLSVKNDSRHPWKWMLSICA